MKRTALALALISTLLFSIVSGTMFVNLASANMFPAGVPEYNVEIKEDGSIIGTDEIQRDGTVYKFTGDVFGSIVVSCDDIVIDGAGHALKGNGTSTGFFLQGRNNVAIRNVRISNFRTGIVSTWWWPLGTKENPNNVFQGNTITDNKYGITSDLVGGVTIYDNIISNNEVGISVFCLDYLAVSGNHISNNCEGIKIIDAKGGVYNNNFVNNTLQANVDPDSNPGQYYGKISVIHWHNNFWSDYNSVDVDQNGVGDVPYIIDAYNLDNHPQIVAYGISNLVPSITVLEPENKNYDTSSISLNFTVNEAVSQITYSLDGKDNITISGNTTLTGLANGDHNLTLCGMDETGTLGTLETMYFSVDVPFPTSLIVTVSGASIIAIGVGLLVYFKKRKHQSE